jgi:hypothetical protein
MIPMMAKVKKAAMRKRTKFFRETLLHMLAELVGAGGILLSLRSGQGSGVDCVRIANVPAGDGSECIGNEGQNGKGLRDKRL